MKSRKIKLADRRGLRACVEQLQAIVDGLRAGSIEMQQGSVDVQLRPGGMLEFELRLEQLARRETIKLELNWRPEALRAADPVELDEEEGPISELPPPPDAPFAWRASEDPASESSAYAAHGGYANGQASYGYAAHGYSTDGSVSPPPWSALGSWHDPSGAELEEPDSAQRLDRIAAEEYQRLYTAARCRGSDGEWRLDKDRLIAGLARAGVDALTQQELYSLAAQADADDRSILFSEQAISALKVASLRRASAS